VFCQEADTGVFPIQTWGDFKQQFQIYFFSVNTKADAINILEEISYHQEGWTMDNFQALVFNIDYIDPRMLMVKFR